MKRVERPHGILFAAIVASMGMSVLPSCGGTEVRRDVAPSGIDGPAVRLDTGVRDAAPDRAPDGGPGVEVAGLDAGATVVDTKLAEANPVEPDGAAPPDVPTQQTDATWPPEVGPDQALPPDLPLGDDGQPVPLDVATSDRPLSDDAPTGDDGRRDVSMSDAPGIDTAGIDTAPIEVGSPGLLTGWPTAALDFGANPCGGEALAAMTFTLTNMGGTTVTLTKARFTGTGYTSNAEGKTVPSAESLVVTVSAPPVPPTANLPTAYDDILAIETDIPNDDQHLISVTESAQGAILVWDTVPEFGAFGALAPGHTTGASFHVINMGNVTAQVTLATTGQFTVTSQTPVTILARSASDSAIAFVPTIGGAAVGTLAMGLATPVALCQPLPAALALTGTSINGALALSSVSLSFTSECGAETPDSKTLTVTNTGTVAMTWSAALEAGSGSAFEISPTTSTLTPPDGGSEPSAVITVTPTAPSGATPITDAINITTDAIGDTTHKVIITQSALGDVVSVVGPDSIDLGSVPIVSPQLESAPVAVTLRNDANPNSAPAVVSLQLTGTHAAYFTVTPTAVSIAAGTQATVNVSFSPGTNPAIVTSGNHLDLAAILHWSIGSEANCGSAAGDVTVNATATLGQTSGIPGQLDFGLVNCGEAGLQKQFTIVNSGSATFLVTSLTQTNPTYYAVDYPTLPKTMSPTDSMVVTVTPGRLPATLSTLPDHSAYDGKLTITTNIVGDLPHEVTLLMGARGAIIANQLWPTEWNFGTASPLDTRELLLPVVNAGNVPVTATLQDVIVAPGELSVFSLDGPAILPANQTANIVALFHPNAPGKTFTASARLVLSAASDTVFCQPLPAGWNSATQNIHMQGQSTLGPQ